MAVVTTDSIMDTFLEQKKEIYTFNEEPAPTITKQSSSSDLINFGVSNFHNSPYNLDPAFAN